MGRKLTTMWRGGSWRRGRRSEIKLRWSQIILKTRLRSYETNLRTMSRALGRCRRCCQRFHWRRTSVSQPAQHRHIYHKLQQHGPTDRWPASCFSLSGLNSHRISQLWSVCYPAIDNRPQPTGENQKQRVMLQWPSIRYGPAKVISLTPTQGHFLIKLVIIEYI